MKKLLAILLAVTMLVTVSAFAIGADSDSFCEHYIPNGNVYGASYDYAMGYHYAEAGSQHNTMNTTVELFCSIGGGSNYLGSAGVGNWSTASTPSYNFWTAADLTGFCSCSHSTY